MLTPEYLQAVVQATEQSVFKVNEYLIGKLVERLEKTFKDTGEATLLPSDVYKIRQMQQTGMLVEDIEKEIEKRLPYIQKEVKTAFNNVSDIIADDLATVTTEMTDGLKGKRMDDGSPESKYGMTSKEVEMLDSAYRRTNGSIKNLTKTTARCCSEDFVEVCDNAYFKIMHGVSQDTAIAEAIRELSAKGIRVVSYGGKKDKMEVAVARAIRTGVNQAHGDIKLARAYSLGINTVIVSQHVGARVTDKNDYTNHSYWQGKQYYLDWNAPELSKYKSDDDERYKTIFAKARAKAKTLFAKVKYKDFIEECGYGNILGICGINCRHSFDVAYPGVKNNQKPIDTEENEERYKLEQKARYMERNIRKDMLTLEAYRSATQTPVVQQNIDKLKKDLTKKNEAYTKFCRENHLPMQNWRRMI